jgi:2,5-diketo-D-gluconate reductase B
MKLHLIGLGTWHLKGHECTQIVKHALELGYRHIDTALNYENHEAIQKGIHHFDRSQLYITSKVALDQHLDPNNLLDSVEESCDLALKQLGTDYLDLYLIHWPLRKFPLSEIFRRMEDLVRKGKIKKAGVSNFNSHHIQDLLTDGCKPFANQVEFHPYLYQKELWEYCKLQHIQLIAYRPFGKGVLLEDPILQKIAAHHNKNASQVILRWLIQKEIPTIPRTASKEHLAENIAIFDFSLSDDEMEKIDKLNQNQRFCKPDNPEFNY